MTEQPVAIVAAPTPNFTVTDQRHLRRVLGTFPTGVALVTARNRDEDHGLVVNSFSSVSLDPPLVAFCAGEASTTWPHIRQAGRCAISFLDENQSDLCRSFTRKDAERFSRHEWERASSGVLIPQGMVGWLDCTIEMVTRAGDHDMVVLAVIDGGSGPSDNPLIFHGGMLGGLA
ncbi:MAG: flavin reductase [Kocuria rhizophila]|nr:MAG: flavin reductase [Kocuria rhizophila]